MNPCAILQQYLELCSSDTSQLLYMLASNAVLDWNGITVRGRSKIVKFLRRKQLEGVVQTFSNATAVEAFEERETHIGTKRTPPENLTKCEDFEQRTEQPEEQEQQLLASPSTSSSEFTSKRNDLSYETPPRTLPVAQHPPPLTGGREFLPLSSDDEEDDGCPSVSKHAEDSPPPPDEPKFNTHSELKYLEATGILRTAIGPKHRGIRATHHIPREESSSSGSSDTQTAATEHTEKRAKLKLSYRLHLRTREAQFALLVYEHIPSHSTTVRRNLFSNDEKQSLDDTVAESSSPTRHPQINHSPQPQPLPESPPSSEPPVQESSPQTPLLQPPGTPIKRRRIPPASASGRRTTPRRSRPADEYSLLSETGATSSSSSTSHNNNITQQTWPRKNPSSRPPDSPSTKRRNLTSTTIRKPLRF